MTPLLAVATVLVGVGVTAASNSSPRSTLLFAVGGLDENYDVLSSVEIYDAATKTWQAGKAMAAGRFGHAAAMLEGKLHVFGGQDGNSSLASMEVYDPETKSWQAGESMLSNRFGHAAVVLGDKLYAVGGFLDGVGPLSSVEVYDPVTKAWTAGPALRQNRSNLAAVVVAGKIYAFGGGYGDALASMEVFDPTTSRWSAGPAMPTRRDDLAAAVLEGKIYAVGGISNEQNDGKALASIDIYDPATKTWESGPASGGVSPREEMAVGVAGGKLFVVGGMPDNDVDSEPYNSVDGFDPTTKKWSKVAAMSQKRHTLAVAVV